MGNFPNLLPKSLILLFLQESLLPPCSVAVLKSSGKSGRTINSTTTKIHRKEKWKCALKPWNMTPIPLPLNTKWDDKLSWLFIGLSFLSEPIFIDFLSRFSWTHLPILSLLWSAWWYWCWSCLCDCFDGRVAVKPIKCIYTLRSQLVSECDSNNNNTNLDEE